VLPLDSPLDRKLIFNPCQAEHGKEYHYPLRHPPVNGTSTYQDQSTPQCSPSPINGDMYNSEQLNYPDIVPVTNDPIDHETRSPPHLIPDYGKMEMADSPISDFFFVKTEPLDVNSSQDIHQLLRGMPDFDQNILVDQYLNNLDLDINMDNLDDIAGYHNPIVDETNSITMNNLESTAGYQVLIVDEANSGSTLPLSQQAFDNQEFPVPNNINPSVHERQSQTNYSSPGGMSFSHNTANDIFSYILNPFSTYTCSFQEVESPIYDSFGIFPP
jgi:hypothetical protein